MQIAIVGGQVHADEADGCAAPWRPSATTAPSTSSARSSSTACAARLRPRDFAERCFKQIEGFGTYGFPESHATSFAHPRLRLGLDQMPLPGRVLRRDAQQPADGLLPAGPARARRARARGRGAPARRQRQRLGLHAGAGRGAEGPRTLRRAARPAPDHGAEEGGDRDAWSRRARGNGAQSVEQLGAIEGVSRRALERLAEADAFRSLGLDRREALWAVRGLDEAGLERTAPRLDRPRRCSRAIAATTSSTRSRRRAAAHGAPRAGGRGLPHHQPVAEGPPVRLLPPACCAGLGAIAAPSTAARRSPLNGRAHGRRPRAGAPAAGHGQGRRLPDPRGRDRHRQHRRLARRASRPTGAW